VFVLLGCTSSPEELDRAQCTKLRDHMIDLRLQDSGGSGMDVDAHRAVFQQALGDNFVSDCLKTLDLPRVKCALEASDQAAASACSHLANN
jgi:hypothetical protein